MEFNIMCSVRYLGATKLIPVNKATKFVDVVEIVSGVWGRLLGNEFTISCEVGDISNILIGSQEDLSNLLCICEIQCVRVVYANVEKNKELTEGENVISSECLCVEGRQVGFSELGNELVINCNSGVRGMLCENVSLKNSIVVPSTMNPLLSDQCGNLMKGGVGTLYYGSAVEFRLALIKYCSKVGARINYVRNSPTLIYVVCLYNLTEGCNWYVKARLVVEKKSFLVYSAELNHSCSCQKFSKLSSDMLTPRLIAELLTPNVQNKSDMCAKDVVDAMKLDSPDEEEDERLYLRSNASDDELGEKDRCVTGVNVTGSNSVKITSRDEKSAAKFGRKLTALEIPSKDNLLVKLMNESQISQLSIKGSFPGSPLDVDECISQRISLHKETKSFHLGKHLSSKWSTGAGPRIGCLRDYPSRLQNDTLEQVNLSLRSKKRVRLYSPGQAESTRSSSKLSCRSRHHCAMQQLSPVKGLIL